MRAMMSVLSEGMSKMRFGRGFGSIIGKDGVGV